MLLSAKRDESRSIFFVFLFSYLCSADLVDIFPDGWCALQAGRAAVPHPAAAQHPAHQTAARPAPGGGAGGRAGEGGGQEEQGGAQGRVQVAGLGLQAPVLPRLLAEEVPGGGEGADEVISI